MRGRRLAKISRRRGSLAARACSTNRHHPLYARSDFRKIREAQESQVAYGRPLQSFFSLERGIAHKGQKV